MRNLLTLLTLLFSLSVAAQPMTINGAGATFPFPIYSKWISEYEKVDKTVRFNYQSIGSGGGVRQLLNQTVDFGASDDPLNDKDMQKSAENGWPILHVPTVIGSVVMAYNLDGVDTSLNFDGDTISAIYLGSIKKWNDPRLQKLNPDVQLPAQDILVVRRADGSGTTAVFSDYLSNVSPEWKSKVGHGKSLRWPTGIGARGNEGVTAMIKQTNGAIGYIELAYAIQNELNIGKVKNKAGQFQEPNIESISLAASSYTDFTGDFRVSIVNSDVPNAYPIAAFTYILLPQKKTEDDRLKAVKKFLKWAISDGQKFTSELHYAPLPKKLAQALEKRI